MEDYQKNSISKTILIYMVIIGTISVVSAGGMWAVFEHTRFKEEVRLMRESYIASQKAVLKREVEGAINFAKFMQSQAEVRLKETIRDRVYEAHAIATNLYEQHRKNKSTNEIRQMVKEALRPIRFNHTRGYYFAFDLDGIETLFAARPEMEGLNMLRVRSDKGEFVVADMLALVERQGEGFYQYTWPKPKHEGFFPKIAFVKLFKPLNWVIGTGEYLDDVEKDLQAEVIQWISKIKFGKDGYVFAGQWDGLSLSGPATGKNMLSITDANGVKIVEELINVARLGGGYVQYTLPKFEGRKNALKMSYAAALQDWQWYIGAGAYVDEIEAVIQIKQAELTHRIEKHFVYAATLLGAVLIVVLLTVKLISKKIHNSLESFTLFFEQSSSKKLKIDPRRLHYSDFHNLAVSANEMIEKRDATEKELEESRTWLRTLLDAMQSGVIVIDASSHRIIDINQTALKLIGADRDKIIDNQCWQFLCPSEKNACPITDLGEYINQSERVLVTYDGHEIPVLKTCNILNINDKAYIIESFLDLTEQKRLQEQLRQAHKLESLGMLAGGVSHDLNNMLSPIIGFSEIVLMDLSDDDPLKEKLERIHNAGIKAKDLVHQLLAFSRKQALEIKTVDINAVIEGLEKLLERTIPENINLEILLDPQCPKVLADSGQIEQVILNLMLNARDAMPDGGTLRVETHQRNIRLNQKGAPEGLPPGTYVQVEVIDTGHGIDPSRVDKIFDPFFTTKEKGKGTGLGLAMAYGIIKQHSGSIQVASMPNKGTCLSILIPIAESRTAIQLPTDNTSTHFQGTGTIVVVEDDESVRELASDILQKFGYSVMAASCAQECISMLSGFQGKLELVLTDVVMPDMNGRELFEKLKEKHRGIKVLFMSGYTDQIIDRHGILEEGFQFVQKPFSVELLTEKIRGILEKEPASDLCALC